MQCCKSVQNSTTQGVASLTGLLGINLAGLNIPIGFTCSGISVCVNGHNRTLAETYDHYYSCLVCSAGTGAVRPPVVVAMFISVRSRELFPKCLQS